MTTTTNTTPPTDDEQAAMRARVDAATEGVLFWSGNPTNAMKTELALKHYGLS